MKPVFIAMALLFALFSAAAQNSPTIDQVSNQSAMEDAAEQTIVLTGITDGDNSGQPLSISVTSDNQTLFSKLEIVTGTADTTLLYQPAPDANGSALVTVSVTDTNDGTTNMEFTITIIAVNDPPTIDPHADITVDEDVGLVHVTLTGISGGPADENQGLAFTMYSSNPAIVDSMYMNYSTGDAEAIVDIAVNADSAGVSNIQIQIIDEIYSNLVTIKFDLTVQPVNDAPTLDMINDEAIENDELEHIINLTGISEGPQNERNQTLTFDVTSDNSSLFSNLTVDYIEDSATGVLRYTPASSTAGVANVTVRLSDDGGTSNGGVDYVEHTFEISVYNVATEIKNLNETALTLYPNPVSNLLNVTLPSTVTGNVDIDVYTVSGKKVLSKHDNGNRLQIPVSDLANGWYQIVVASKNEIYTGQFLVK